MGAAEVMVPRVDAVRPVFLTVWSAVALVSEKKKMNKAAHSAKRSFLPHVCEPTQVNTGTAQPHNLWADSGETDVSSCRLSVPHGARIRVGGG